MAHVSIIPKWKEVYFMAYINWEVCEDLKIYQEFIIHIILKDIRNVTLFFDWMVHIFCMDFVFSYRRKWWYEEEFRRGKYRKILLHHKEQGCQGPGRMNWYWNRIRSLQEMHPNNTNNNR